MQPLWKAVWSYLKKLKMELPYGPAIPFFLTYPKKLNTNLKESMHTYVHYSTIYNSQDLETAQMSISR